jgi:plastocyanin
MRIKALHKGRAWLLRGALLALAAMPGAHGETPPARATIELHQYMFRPSSLTVPVGTIVAWKNLDEEPHTVASLDGKFRSGAIDQDETFVHTFAVAGTYRYVCSIHPQMVGTVIVTPAAK